MPRFQAYAYMELSLPIVGEDRNRFSDWLWSRYGVRAAAMSISERCGISHAVRYRSRTSAGIQASSWIEPLASVIASRVVRSHTPSFFRSSTRYALTWRNSPLSVSRLKRLETCGSMHSYTPAIEAMVAVGAIASSSELRMPVSAIRARSAAHRSAHVGSASG